MSQIIIKEINENKIRLNVDGEVKEIQNQLAELKTILQNQKEQKVQYAEKIYNIENINEANFGFLSGKKAFRDYSLNKVRLFFLLVIIISYFGIF